MTTREESFELRNLGIGTPVDPEPDVEPDTIVYDSWQLGIVTADSPEAIPPSAAQDAIDVRIDRDDSLMRLEGVAVDLDITPQSILYLFQHASLDFATELIVIDPPSIGHKSIGAFTFNNLSIAATNTKGWNVANVAGTLLFSNGVDATYTRQPGASTVTDISADVIADTFATAFGRVFAGAYTDPLSGYQGLGIRWNGTGAPPETDWGSANAQAELLIANQQEADRIIALRPIGFDALCVLTRKMIWMGYQTGVDNHPAQFRLRFPARGCVAEPTAVVCPYGVIYLSDEGVVVANLNNADIISASINASLLPLNYAQLSQYRAVYQTVRDRYVLATPTGTWFYEFPKADQNGNQIVPARWYFSSLIPDSLVIFTNQDGTLTWDSMQGSWADQVLTWAQLSVNELDSAPVLYFGRGTKLGFEDASTFTYFGDAQNPLWITSEKKKVADLVNTIWFEIQWSAESEAHLEFATVDTNGDFTNTRTVVLPSTGGARRTSTFPFAGVGQQAAVRIRFVSGTANISWLKQMYLPAGKFQSSLQILD